MFEGVHEMLLGFSHRSELRVCRDVRSEKLLIWTKYTYLGRSKQEKPMENVVINELLGCDSPTASWAHGAGTEGVLGPC